MTKIEIPSIEGTDDAWDEGTLGADEAYAMAAPAHLEAAVEESLGLQSVSIRLPKNMIAAYKLIAAFHGVGYQPLMRDILQRYVPMGMQEVLEHQKQKAAEVEERFEAMKKAA